MTATRSSDASYTVELSVNGHSYCADLWRRGEADWILLSLRVGDVLAQQINWRASSCLDALAAAEALAKQVLEQQRLKRAVEAGAVS